jgi:uncharacterized protein (DUF169 family)
MSLIAEKLELTVRPVAVYRSPEIPKGAEVPQGHCAVPSLLLKCARTGKVCATDASHLGCRGAAGGLGFGGIPDRQRRACMMSTGVEGSDHQPKHDFKTPEIAMRQLSGIRDYGDGEDAIVFQDLGEAEAEKRDIEVVVFIADPSRISALALLAGFGYEGEGEAVIMPYGHACEQIYALPRAEGEREHPRAVVGFTDLFARRYIDRDKLTFAVPYRLYKRMEADVPGSFMGKDDWKETFGKCL